MINFTAVVWCKGGLAANQDRFDGGAGNDILSDGLGRQDMTGGAGSDAFTFGSPSGLGLGKQADRIMDFQHGVDHIEMIVDSGAPAPFPSLSFIDTAAFSATTAMELRVAAVNGETVLQFGNANIGVKWEIHFDHIVKIDLDDLWI